MYRLAGGTKGSCRNETLGKGRAPRLTRPPSLIQGCRESGVDLNLLGDGWQEAGARSLGVAQRPGRARRRLSWRRPQASSSRAWNEAGSRCNRAIPRWRGPSKAEGRPVPSIMDRLRSPPWESLPARPPWTCAGTAPPTRCCPKPFNGQQSSHPEGSPSPLASYPSSARERDETYLPLPAPRRCCSA